MSLSYNGFMGPVIGRLGPMVGYLWRGRPVFRAYVPHIRYPNTPGQQAEREWFVSMVRFAAEARPALLLGMRELAVRERMTEGNTFVKRNKQHFRRQAAGDAPLADYSRLALSAGPVAPVTPTSADIAADGILTVIFNKNSAMHRAKGIDSVHLYVYDATERRGLLAAAVHRCAGRVALRLPNAWQHHDLHCYLFATDLHALASPTSYIAPALQETQPTDIEGNTNTSTPHNKNTYSQFSAEPTLTLSPINPHPRGKPS
ncbi:MAG: hypothetical protein J6V98_03215 [Bacteroidales bacterium]|nr:hypothetical protein [Bacteroidales bacterium]